MDVGQVLHIKTVQIAPFRTLMGALKDILLEANITFTPEGMSIVSMDKSHTVLVNLQLRAENFEEFTCAFPRIVVGVNVMHLSKLVNTIDNDDILTMFIDRADYEEGVVTYLGLKFENGDIKQCKVQRLKLIEPDPEELQVPAVSFSSVITLPSGDFQKIVRDLSSVSERLEIVSVGAELVFRCKGPFAEVEVRRSENSHNMEFVVRPDDARVIQGEFSLKNLGYFIKCTNLCTTIDMYLENKLPVIVRYAVASLGEIRLCLAPLPACPGN